MQQVFLPIETEGEFPRIFERSLMLAEQLEDSPHPVHLLVAVAWSHQITVPSLTTNKRLLYNRVTSTHGYPDSR